MTAPRFRPDHCTAEHPCWECWQGFEPRVFEADVQSTWGELEYLVIVQSVEAFETAQRLQYLISKQWREMTRAPFAFAPAKTESITAAVIDLDELFK